MKLEVEKRKRLQLVFIYRCTEKQNSESEGHFYTNVGFLSIKCTNLTQR